MPLVAGRAWLLTVGAHGLIGDGEQRSDLGKFSLSLVVQNPRNG